MAKSKKMPPDKDIRVLLPNGWLNIPKHSGEVHITRGIPSSGSYGDSLLSKHFYRSSDRRDYVKKFHPYEFYYARARKIFLRRFKKKNGGKLHCEYCKRGPLKADNGNFFSTLKNATIDHKVPLSKGGKRFDFDNMACSCEKCNRKKGDKEQWKPAHS